MAAHGLSTTSQAAILRHQLQEDNFRALDPNIDARKACQVILNEYAALLVGSPKEEVLQDYLKNHPAMLCATYQKMWLKLTLGARVTDYVFRQADGDYLLVDIEKPSTRIFIKNEDTSADLNHARDQIIDWKHYLEDNLSTVQRELHLDGISTNPYRLLVIGRSSDLSDSDRRKLVSLNNDAPKLKILTYDDVRANAKAAMSNIVGPLDEWEGTAIIYYLTSSALNPTA